MMVKSSPVLGYLFPDSPFFVFSRSPVQTAAVLQSMNRDIACLLQV